jgi:hypothetical protein
VEELSAHVDVLKSALAEAEYAHAELQTIGNSLTWRLRARLLGIPGVRAAARALARPGAPEAAEPHDRDPRRAP